MYNKAFNCLVKDTYSNCVSFMIMIKIIHVFSIVKIIAIMLTMTLIVLLVTEEHITSYY